MSAATAIDGTPSINLDGIVSLEDEWRELLTEQWHGAIVELGQAYPDCRRLDVPWAALSDRLRHDVIVDPGVVLLAAGQALSALVTEARGRESPCRVAIPNLPSLYERSLKELRSEERGQLVSVRGLVHKVKVTKPMIVVAHWKCNRCGHLTIIRQDDRLTLLDPVECIQADGGCGRGKGKTTWTMLDDESEYANRQFIVIEEDGRQLRASSLPATLSVWLEHDLLDQVTGGDHVEIVGMVGIEHDYAHGRKTPAGHFFLRGIHLAVTNRPSADVRVTSDLRGRLEKELLKGGEAEGPLPVADVMKRLEASFAPAIVGHPHIKLSLALQLFSPANEAGPRDAFHVFLLGDPGTAKSQLIQRSAQVSPRSRQVSGKEASLPGVLYAVDRSAQGGVTAGALVVASGGVCVMDEFDKMSSDILGGLHGPLEHGYVTPAKAGARGFLPARTAVAAAANPKDQMLHNGDPAIDQLTLDAALVSRFDLIWVIPDVADADLDALVARKMLKRFQRQPEPREFGIDDEYLRAWIAVALERPRPRWSTEAEELAIADYRDLRSQAGTELASRVSPRLHDSTVRIATACARACLADEVTIGHYEVAKRLLKQSRDELGHNPEREPRKPQQVGNETLVQWIENYVRENGGCTLAAIVSAAPGIHGSSADAARIERLVHKMRHEQPVRLYGPDDMIRSVM